MKNRTPRARQIILALLGLLFTFFDPSWRGLNLQPLPGPIVSILQGIGVSLFVAATVSFGVEELIRGSTLNEFREEMDKLLGATGRKLTSELIGFLQSYNAELVRRTEELGSEIQSSNIKSIHASRSKGLEEMAIAIKEANSFIYIIGISLREFFQENTPCLRAVAEVYHGAKDIKFRVLVLNNRSPDALGRSSREEGITFGYVHDQEYVSSKLFLETRATIRKIKKEYTKMALRVYDNQSLFLLITDKVAFMEPYHYGERVIEERGLFKRVAELVPLIEFEKATERGPYEQFLGHFEYVFDKAKEPTEENVRVQHDQ